MARLISMMPRTAAACAGSSLWATARSVTPTMRRCCAWAATLERESAKASTDTRLTIRLVLRGGAPSLLAMRMPHVCAGLKRYLRPSAYDLVGLNPDYVDQFFYGAGRLIERGLFVGRQLDLDNLLDALRAQLDRHADEQVVHTVLALQEDRARHDLLLILQDRFDHQRRRRARRIPGAGAHQLGDFGATVGGALRDRLDAIRRHQFCNRNARHGGVARQRHHRVAVAAEHKRRDVLNRHVQLHRDERAHARRVEHAGHADDALARELTEAVDRLRHRVERIGHRNNDAVGRMLDDLGGDVLHDLVIHVQQVVAAHAVLARHAGSDDDDVGVGAFGEILRADPDHARRRAFDRARFVNVERDAGGFRIRNVNDYDVSELFLRDRTRHRCADIARAANHRHFPIHACTPLGHVPFVTRGRLLLNPQQLWKTLWKRPRVRRVTPLIWNKSADCTIHGA